MIPAQMKAASHSSSDIMFGQGSQTADSGQLLLPNLGFDCD